MTVASMLRDMRAAHAARVQYQQDARRLMRWAREAEAEGWFEIGKEYRRMAKIAANAALAEGVR